MDLYAHYFGLCRFIILFRTFTDLQGAVKNKYYNHNSNRSCEDTGNLQANAGQGRTMLFIFTLVTNAHSILRNKWYVPDTGSQR